jgi:hypothetical protein
MGKLFSFRLIGFDFEELNNIMDYYIIGFEMFNPCNDLYKGGIVPLYNDQNKIYSLVKYLYK